MKNPEQGSFARMVRQNGPQFPVIDTINAPLTPRQAERAAQFLAMLTPKIAPETVEMDKGQAQEQTVPRCKSYEEISAERAERRARNPYRKPRKKPNTWQRYKAPAASEGMQEAEERPAWLLDALECLNEPEVASSAQPAPKMRRQVERQAVPLLADLLDLEQFRPKRGRGYGTAGAGALAALLDEYARTALAHRLYLYDEDGKPPRQIVLHLCAELIAATLKVSENTVRDWTAQLTEAGYLYARAHHTTATLEGEQVTVVDGMLYAVRLAPGHEARLRYEDYKKQYRNLDADRAAGRTAYNAIRNAQRRAEELAEAENLNAVLDDEKNTEGSQDLTGRVQAELREQLRRWAVIPGNITTENPLNTDPAVFSPEEVAARLNGVQDVVYLLPTLTEAHVSKRAALVGIMASAIAKDLGDQKSRAYFCKIIWQAWQDELEGRSGLQHLAAQLQRLEVDRREWKELRNPAALLAARLRAA